jgi:hypothetical protein
LARQHEEFLEKERRLAEEEELQPWNVDTIGRVGWSRSIINKEKKSDADVESQTDETVSALIFMIHMYLIALHMYLYPFRFDSSMRMRSCSSDFRR